MLSFFSSLSEVMFKFTNLVMYFAPIGVGAAMAFTVGQMGIGVLLNLGKLLLTLYVALIAFTLLVLLLSALLFRVPSCAAFCQRSPSPRRLPSPPRRARLRCPAPWSPWRRSESRAAS